MEDASSLEAQQVKKSKTNQRNVGLVIFAVVIAVYVYIAGDNYRTSDLIGRLIGSYIAYLTIAFVISYMPGLRKTSVTLIASLLFILGSYGMFTEDISGPKQSASNVLQAIKSLNAGHELKNPGHMGKLKPFYDVYVDGTKSLISAGEEYSALVSSADFQSILSAKSLVSASEIPGSLEHAKQLLGNYERAVNGYKARMTKNVNESTLSQTLKNDFIAGLNKNKLIPIYKEYVEVQKKLLNEYIAIYELVITSNTTLSKDGSQVLFEGDLELALFNKMTERLQELAQEEYEVTQNFAAGYNRAQENMDNVQKKLDQ